MARGPRHVNERDLPAFPISSPKESALLLRKALGGATGSKKLGCSLIELPPGKDSWPYHYHEANEEAVYVLEGLGKVRTPAGIFPLEPGDYISFPVGEQGGHKYINDSDEPLRFLTISTMIEPEVCVYPDSGKFAVFAGPAPGSGSYENRLNAIARQDATIGYWDGEAE